ncbi:MAG: alpha/beta fold hydrolase [Alcanivorax sp.]
MFARALKITQFFAVFLFFAVYSVQSSAQEHKKYGPHLEGFSYPYPASDYAFTSQGQNLKMGFMDVSPKLKSNGKTVVLLHGKNFCGATWEQTIAFLSKAGYRVIAPDQVGFCRSSKPQGYQFSFHQLAENTHALLKEQGVENAIVMGHSMGGMLATRFALMYPEFVDQLVLVNLIGLEDWKAKGVPYVDIDTLYAGELKKSYEGIKAYQSKYYYGGNWKPEYDKWVDMLYGMYLGEGKEQVAYNQAQTTEMLFTQPVVYEFKNLKVPTLLMLGQLDRTAPGANRVSKEVAATLGNYPVLGKEIADQIPQAKLLEFPDLGHSPQVQAPEIFHTVLMRELK